MRMRQLLTSFLIGASLALAGCADMFSIHKLDIQQGNALSEEAVAKVKPGMSTAQVEFILGRPVLSDPFHAERWDYVYYLKRADTPAQRARVTVYFEGDRVLRVEREGV